MLIQVAGQWGKDNLRGRAAVEMVATPPVTVLGVPFWRRHVSIPPVTIDPNPPPPYAFCDVYLLGYVVSAIAARLVNGLVDFNAWCGWPGLELMSVLAAPQVPPRPGFVPVHQSRVCRLSPPSREWEALLSRMTGTAEAISA